MAAKAEEETSSTQWNYEALKSKGKALARSGRLEEAMDYLKKAYRMVPSSKLKDHIKKIRSILEEQEQASIEMVEICEGFHMSTDMYKNLYPYQRDAVKWMWDLYQKKKGGVLGDDMGLGKTIQIIAFLSAMMEAELIKTALLIMPVSLIENWKKEFSKWSPEIVVKEYHATSKKDRELSLRKIQISGGVLLTTYGIVGKNVELLRNKDDRHFIWDYIVLDEGHKIKNPTKTTKAVHEIYAKHRIVLTGTPIQNNLKELWSLYDFVQQGTLLGSLQTFKMQYETPITRSREKDATAAEKILGSRIAENLRTRIAPYFLRRTKQEVLESKGETDGKDSKAFSRLKREMGNIQKNEFIVWVFLSPVQIKIYQDFLESDQVKNILVTKRSPLVELTVLKKISDHPRLLSHRACVQLGLDGSMSQEELAATLDDDVTAFFDIKHTPDNVLIDESGKMGVLFQLLENLRSEGHRTLVFSQSCRILDIIQKVLCNRGWKVLRLDGKIRKTNDREKVISAFQNNPSYPVFLLTSQVGGVGLTLTAADRVVIYDPSWNPATDAQAVDRAFRIGQTKSVVVYRLITCGSVEEKIYRRQIFKDSIMQQTTGKTQDPHRYFTREELRELFILGDPKVSTTQLQLESLHGGQRKTDTVLDSHIAFLYSLDIFGISDHDLMFKGLAEDKSNKEEVSADYIKEKVQRAEMLLSLESDLTKDTLIKTGSYAKTFDVPLLKSNKASGIPQIQDKHPTEYEIIDLIPEKVSSLEDIAQRISSLDVTSEEIKAKFSSEKIKSENSSEKIRPKSENSSEKIKSEHSATTSRTTHHVSFCRIESSEDEMTDDEYPPVAHKMEVEEAILISDEEDVCQGVSQTRSDQINGVNISKGNSLVPANLSTGSERFPLGNQSQTEAASANSSKRNSLLPADLSTGSERFPLDNQSRTETASVNISNRSSLLPADLSMGSEHFPLDDQSQTEAIEQEASQSPGLMHDVPKSYDEFCKDAQFQGDRSEESKRNVSGKMSLTSSQFSEINGGSSCSTTPHASDSENDDAVPVNKLSLTADRFCSDNIPRKTGSCSTTPELSSDSDDDFERPTERSIANELSQERLRKVCKSPVFSIKNGSYKDTSAEMENSFSLKVNDSNSNDPSLIADTPSTRSSQKRSSPELSDTDEESYRNPFEESRKLRRIKSPKKSDLVRVHQKSDVSNDKSLPVFVSNISASLNVQLANDKNQVVKSFVSNDSLHKLFHDDSRSGENQQLTSHLNTSLDDFELATNLKFPQSRGARQKSVAHQKWDYLSNSVFVNNNNNTAAAVHVQLANDKNQGVKSFVSNDSLHKLIQDDSRSDENQQLASHLNISVDDFELATNLKSPQSRDARQKSVAHQKWDNLSNSVFVNNTAAAVHVQCAKDKNQSLRSFANDSWQRQFQDNSGLESQQLSTRLSDSFDDFQSATSKIFEDLVDSFEENCPSFSVSTRPASRPSTETKVKRRSIVMAIETSDEESDHEPDRLQSREELVGDSFNSQEASDEETSAQRTVGDSFNSQASGEETSVRRTDELDGDQSRQDFVEDSLNSQQENCSETFYSSGDMTE